MNKQNIDQMYLYFQKTNILRTKNKINACKTPFLG